MYLLYKEQANGIANITFKLITPNKPYMDWTAGGTESIMFPANEEADPHNFFFLDRSFQVEKNFHYMSFTGSSVKQLVNNYRASLADFIDQTLNLRLYNQPYFKRDTSKPYWAEVYFWTLDDIDKLEKDSELSPSEKGIKGTFSRERFEELLRDRYGFKDSHFNNPDYKVSRTQFSKVVSGIKSTLKTLGIELLN